MSPDAPASHTNTFPWLFALRGAVAFGGCRHNPDVQRPESSSLALPMGNFGRLLNFSQVMMCPTCHKRMRMSHKHLLKGHKHGLPGQKRVYKCHACQVTISEVAFEEAAYFRRVQMLTALYSEADRRRSQAEIRLDEVQRSISSGRVQHTTRELIQQLTRFLALTQGKRA